MSAPAPTPDPSLAGACFFFKKGKMLTKKYPESKYFGKSALGGVGIEGLPGEKNCEQQSGRWTNSVELVGNYAFPQ
jgi:hypothetical protein